MTDNKTLCMDACGETGEVVLRSTEPVIRRAGVAFALAAAQPADGKGEKL